MAETDTSPTALRSLAEHLSDEGEHLDATGYHIGAMLCRKAAATLAALAAEKEAGAPAPEGWIPWVGGKCPVPDGVRVEVILRDEDENEARSDILDWQHFGAPNDIIAYRLSKEG